MRKPLLLATAFCAAIGAFALKPGIFMTTRVQAAQTANNADSNPFFSVSTLPYQAPPFDRIKDSDYQPALEEGMKQQIAEIQAIANSSEAPTLENTIVAME